MERSLQSSQQGGGIPIFQRGDWGTESRGHWPRRRKPGLEPGPPVSEEDFDFSATSQTSLLVQWSGVRRGWLWEYFHGKALLYAPMEQCVCIWPQTTYIRAECRELAKKLIPRPTPNLLG